MTSCASTNSPSSMPSATKWCAKARVIQLRACVSRTRRNAARSVGGNDCAEATHATPGSVPGTATVQPPPMAAAPNGGLSGHCAFSALVALKACFASTSPPKLSARPPVGFKSFASSSALAPSFGGSGAASNLPLASAASAVSASRRSGVPHRTPGVARWLAPSAQRKSRSSNIDRANGAPGVRCAWCCMLIAAAAMPLRASFVSGLSPAGAACGWRFTYSMAACVCTQNERCDPWMSEKATPSTALVDSRFVVVSCGDGIVATDVSSALGAKALSPPLYILRDMPEPVPPHTE
mmetsp:Transcript_46106/g.142002  ORF Transcript_46106/g.142002 Transcript_46106/m.142002 type:complete len:294 (-) Transcript_46106:474-1355(-)